MADHFPRGLLALRSYYAAEEALARPPLILAGVVIGAVAGTAHGVGSQKVVRQGGQLIVPAPSFAGVLFWTIVGTGLGAFAVFALGFLYDLVRYRVAGDPVWECVYEGGAFQVKCRDSDEPRHYQELRAMGCRVRTPSGRIIKSTSADLTPLAGARPGVVAKLALPDEQGHFEARWYARADRPRVHEIARKKVWLPPDSAPRREVLTDGPP